MKPIYEVSKFLTLQMLITPQEFRMMRGSFGKLLWFDNSRLVSSDQPLSENEVDQMYAEYFESLFSKNQKTLPGLAVTAEKEAVVAVKVGENRWMIKPKTPIMQFKQHQFICGKTGEFFSGVHGDEVVRWGFELSFPQMYVDPESKEVIHVMKDAAFLNSEVFRMAMKWMRYHTRPAQFLINGKIKRATFRLGKEAISYAKDLVDLKRHEMVLA